MASRSRCRASADSCSFGESVGVASMARLMESSRVPRFRRSFLRRGQGLLEFAELLLELDHRSALFHRGGSRAHYFDVLRARQVGYYAVNAFGE